MSTWEDRAINPALFRKSAFQSPQQQAEVTQKARDEAEERFPLPPLNHPLRPEVLTWRMIYADAWVKGHMAALGVPEVEEIPG